jgi:hypothetical protein
MEEPDVMLMLSGVSHPCPDCSDDRVFVPADDEAPGAYCCTDCGAALLLLDLEIEVEHQITRVA